jgi:hypothetical protein
MQPTSLSAPDTRRFSVLITLLVAVLELAHLAWQWTHGGIVSHHLLANPDLPAVSNGWGIVALPALAWIASRRFLRRAVSGAAARRSILMGALGAAGAGIGLSLAFSFGSGDHAALVLLAILLSGIALPIYRAEYLLGFALAMAWTFGPILPTLIGSVIALASFIVRRSVWPAMTWAASRLRPAR